MMNYLSRVLACALVCLSFCSTVDADFIGDDIEASLTIDPDDSNFDETAISGTATVIDPGREYQGEIYSTPNGIDIDFFVDISDEELMFGFERTDSSNGGFGSGFGRTVTLNIWDIDWTGNPIEVEYLEQSVFGDSNWEGDPADFEVITTSTSIQIDFGSAYRLGGDGGFITATYAISSAAVPEPSSFGLIGLCVFGFVRRRSR
jgi:hypothetical protein